MRRQWHLPAGVFLTSGPKHTSMMPCEAAAATATEQPEGQLFLQQLGDGGLKRSFGHNLLTTNMCQQGQNDQQQILWLTALLRIPETHVVEWQTRRHTTKQFGNTGAFACSQGTHKQDTSVISLSHLPPETKITLCRAWLWGNISLFDSYTASLDVEQHADVS